jgi:hypothetical protein
MTPSTGWISCVRLGLAIAWRYRRLVILVWILFLAASLLAAVPAWRWWNATLSLAPEGDRLLDGLNAPLLRELVHYDQSSTYAIAFAPFSAFVLAMLVLNPAIAGGLLSVLFASVEPSANAADSVDSAHLHDKRPVSWRFFEAGARCYWVFLRLMLWAGVFGALLTVLFMSVLLPIMSYVSEANWEQAWLFMGLLFPATLAFVFWLTSLLLDIARVRALRTRERRALRVIAGSLRFMWRHLGATLAVGVAFALLTALTFAVYFTVSSAVTPKSWLAILLMIVWQQALSLTRTGLRVSMLAAEVTLVVSREFLPVAPPAVTIDPVPTSEPMPDLPPLA